MTTPGNARPVVEQPKNLSTVELTERLTEQVSTLVRTEVSHALEEVKSKGTRIGVGVGISGAGAILLFLGLATLIATAVLGLATAVEPWLAALIVALVVLAVGGILAAVGASKAKNAAPPVPERTVASVRADIDAAKGATK
ncbi:phage holin family protein [Rhodococcus pyridinivorans]|uniref:phage holin family protein n=1 Tax=Rhodococcus pyridinivorans TaxID=103816 RepID=UPI001E53930A|nr:phage holin family protein [Rhodococcus pyridinivorans]UGQ57608.1 phage holin family protein [Rhodococcus pyridinivorans]